MTRSPRRAGKRRGAGVRDMRRRAGEAARLVFHANRKAAAAYLVLTIAIGVAPVGVAWLTKFVLDALARDGIGGSHVFVLAASLAALGVLTATLPHLANYASTELGRAVRREVTERLYRTVNGFKGIGRFESPAFLDRLRLGEEAGTTAPQMLVAAGFGMLQAGLVLGSFLVALVVLSPVMALAVVAAAVPTLAAQLSLGRRQADLLSETSHSARRQIFYSSLLVDRQAAKEIRLFGLGSFLLGRMRGEFLAIDDAERDLERRRARIQSLLSLLGALLAGAGLVWAVATARAGRFSVGDVALFVVAVAAVQGGLASFIDQMAQIHEALLRFGHYLEITALGSDLPEPALPRALPRLRSRIEFRDVWFRYADDQRWVLRGVNLVIPAGCALAIVGSNGAGKSTLVKLLCRLYDPTKGAVLWDDVDLLDVPVEELRQRLGVLFQDYMEYDLTAAENIGIGDLDALNDKKRVETAARLADVHATLTALPHGFDTLLSRIFFGSNDESNAETGVALSGGQWQRVALARALMRDGRDLLILDEPSAGLDAEAEHDIHDRLRRHRDGRTSLLISHRLGAIRDADVIVVLDDGRVLEQGTHDELMGAGGQYARFFSLQAQGYEQPSTEVGLPMASAP